MLFIALVVCVPRALKNACDKMVCHKTRIIIINYLINVLSPFTIEADFEV
jgi:hypothetical protein